MVKPAIAAWIAAAALAAQPEPPIQLIQTLPLGVPDHDPAPATIPVFDVTKP
jgi:hypothetical protein